MIKSKIQQGLQAPGKSKYDSSILIEQTDFMRLAVRSGTYIDVWGNSFLLANDAIYDLKADPKKKKVVILGLRTPSSPSTFKQEYLIPDVRPTLPDDCIFLFVGYGWLVIPPGALELPDFYTYSWIDNLPLRRGTDGLYFFIGKDIHTGVNYPIREIKHFAKLRGDRAIYYADPITFEMAEDPTVLERAIPLKYIE